MKISVIGAGSWGLTFANLLAIKGHEVMLYGRREIAQSNPFAYTQKLDEAAANECIVLALPVQQLGSVLTSTVAWNPAAIMVSLAKGIEQKRLLRVSEICASDIKWFDLKLFSVLSGPTLADEVARKLPATAVIASISHDTSAVVQREFSGPLMRLYRSDDVIGVELAGAIKNVIALAAGISAGLNLGHNVLGALVTRGLAEMTRLGVAIGGQRETFAGLAGMGDLITTCSSPLSRNRTVGMRIAAGESLEQILKSMTEVAEGVWTARATLKLAEQHNIEMPITAAVCQILHENKNPQLAIRELMTRTLKAES